MQHRIWTSSGLIVVLAVGGAVLVPRALAAQDTVKVAKPDKPEKVKRGGSNLILESEIAASAAENALDIVQQLRPSMLRARAATGNPDGETGGVSVYVDNVRTGGTESLRNLTRFVIKEIRFLNAGDATQRFGTGNMSGAILVTTRR